MYPAGELSDIEARKAQIRRRIALHRAQCVESAAVVAAPLEKLNRLHAQWQHIAPLVKLAAIPAGFLFTRKFKRTRSVFSTALQWLPTILKVVRGFRAAQPTPEPAEV